MVSFILGGKQGSDTSQMQMWAACLQLHW